MKLELVLSGKKTRRRPRAQKRKLAGRGWKPRDKEADKLELESHIKNVQLAINSAGGSEGGSVSVDTTLILKLNLAFVDAHAATCPASVRISRTIVLRSSTCVCVSSLAFLYCWSLVESGGNRRQRLR